MMQLGLMKSKPINKSYIIIFFLSFLVLSLQIVLSSLLRVYLKLPFFSISFAFLGLSSAGIYSYLKLDKKTPEELMQKLSPCINKFGILFLLYFVFIFKDQVFHRKIFKSFFVENSGSFNFLYLLDSMFLSILFILIKSLLCVIYIIFKKPIL